MNDPRYLHTEEKQEGETFFDVMNRLIARSKAVTADIVLDTNVITSQIKRFYQFTYSAQITVLKSYHFGHIIFPSN